MQRTGDVNKMTEAGQTYKRNKNFGFRQIDNETILMIANDTLSLQLW